MNNKNHQITAMNEMIFKNGILHPHLYLWDSWSYEENNIYHLYCLALSRYNNGELLKPEERNDFPFHVRHFTSKDGGITWKDEGCFLEPSELSRLNFRTIWSGSVELLPNGKKLVAYTGLEKGSDKRNFLQSIALGISDDGMSIDKIQDSVLSSPIRDWKKITELGYYLDKKENLGSDEGEEGGPIMAWRDPFIFIDKNKEIHLFWAAKVSPRIGAIARAKLQENEGTFEIGEFYPPVEVPDSKDFTQLEVPKVIYDQDKECYYLIVSSCNRLYENQPDSEIKKEVRLYKSNNIDGPWQSLGNKILGDNHLFGMTVLSADFKNNRLLCIAPYTEAAQPEQVLSFAPTFYVYLDPLRVEFFY